MTQARSKERRGAGGEILRKGYEKPLTQEKPKPLRDGRRDDTTRTKKEGLGNG